MSADAEMRETAEWRVLFLSDGEITLDDKIRESRRGARRMAGQAVRVIDIAADAGKGFGLFDHIGDCSSGREFSESLLRATEQYFGTAALTYLGCLTADVPGVTGRLKSNIDAFVKEHANDKRRPGRARRQAFRSPGCLRRTCHGVGHPSMEPWRGDGGRAAMFPRMAGSSGHTWPSRDRAGNRTSAPCH